jgi:1-acyl-sn-glycerol-3-phosphate acyltransferase
MKENKVRFNVLRYEDGAYITGEPAVSYFSRLFPSVRFYWSVLLAVFKGSLKAKYSRYDAYEWCRSSLAILRALECIGVRVEIKGIDRISGLDGPCVFVANHMSTLETFVLPVIILPFRDITFVVKEGLVKYPVFKHIMRATEPIVVGRKNPREDLITVLKEGEERLKGGKSVVIFPQTTRTIAFDPEEFNSIGVKLARRAGVPLIPVALKTDAWGNGRFLKDFGKISPSKRVFFAFGSPIHVRERGREEHESIIRFITEHLDRWEEQTGRHA